MNHNLGGPGEQRNLTPITKKMNSAHHSLVEKALKAAATPSTRADAQNAPTTPRWSPTSSSKSEKS